MSETVVIGRRFRGPPESANGGYACGLVARFVEAPTVEARLRVPPPLDTPLAVRRRDGGGAELRDGETLVAAAWPAEPLELEIPEPVPLDEAAAAGAACPWADRHPYPTCFVCGPGRRPPDGLGNLTGPVGERRLVADAWTPDPSLAANGEIDPLVVWAALDCPSGNAPLWFHPPERPVLLGSLTAQRLAPVRPGEPYLTMGWPIAHEGRKRFGGSALLDRAGEPVALARGIWIEARPSAG